MSLRKILIHCSLPEGGIAEHSHYQAQALEDAGVAVTLLTCRQFLSSHTGKRYRQLNWLMAPYVTTSNPWLRRAWFVMATLTNEFMLALVIVLGRFRHVVMASPSETLVLLWIWPHALLGLLGVRYATNIHDPQRKPRDGLGWLHRWAVKASFLPIRYGLIHEDFDPHQPQIPPHVRCLRVPYGCMAAQIGPDDGRSLRAELAPAGAHVFLSFGYIADRKNLDACVEAVAQIPEAILLVAGRVASRHDKPAQFYRDQAARLGCAERVHIFDGFVPDYMIAHFFGAADSVLLTYKAEFVSQSGVLLLAANWGKPVIASSGPGPLVETVRKFDLGPVVPPEDVAALAGAMREVIARGYSDSGWVQLREHASWVRNVAVLRAALEGRADEVAV